MSVRPATCMGQIDCHRTVFRDIDTVVFMKIGKVTMVAKVTSAPVLAMVIPKRQQYLSRRLFLLSSVLTRPQHSLFSDRVLSSTNGNSTVFEPVTFYFLSSVRWLHVLCLFCGMINRVLRKWIFFGRNIQLIKF
jgi:hypothetical protein